MMYCASATKPWSLRMSCGLGGPSDTTSPLSTCSPSKTAICRHLCIRFSTLSPSAVVITRRRFPLVSLPKLTVPLASARIAASFGLRASKRSATRGSPPVISRVLDPSWGTRAITSPTPSFSLASRLKTELLGRK